MTPAVLEAWENLRTVLAGCALQDSVAAKNHALWMSERLKEFAANVGRGDQGQRTWRTQPDWSPRQREINAAGAAECRAALNHTPGETNA